MTDYTRPTSPVPQYSSADRYVPGRGAMPGREPAGLADVLDRILDKGLVIAGDISISLAQVELLTIKIRLLLASADKAQQMGIDWWTRDPSLSGAAAGGGQGGGGQQEGEGDTDPEEEARALRQRVHELEQKLARLLSGGESVASRSEPIALPDILAMREQRTAPPAPRRTSGTEADEGREPGGDGEDERDDESEGARERADDRYDEGRRDQEDERRDDERAQEGDRRGEDDGGDREDEARRQEE
jgi:hypothetical protein